MTKRTHRPKEAADLRQKAEAVFLMQDAQSPEDIASLSPEEILTILHELQVHQIELELQNEELRDSQKELSKSRTGFTELYDLAPVGYSTISSKGLILKANLTLAGMLSMKRRSLIDQPLTAWILFEDQDIFYLHLQNLSTLKTRQVCELRLKKNDGTPFYVQLESNVILDECGETDQYLIIIIDITERKQAEESLLKSEKKFRSLFESVNDSLFVHLLKENNLPGHFIEVNDMACKKLGYSKQELLQLTPRDINAPDDGMNPVEIRNKLLAHGSTLFETMHLTKEGQQIPVESHIRLFDYDGQQAVLSIARDITERKQAEEEKQNLESQLRQSQKMEAIGTLAGGIAHDFNNILTSIIAYAQLLGMERFSDDDHIKDKLDHILQSSYQARDLVKHIMLLSRKTKPIKEPIMLEHVVRDVVKMIRASLPSTINIQKQIHNERCAVFADSTQMHQVMMNLCTNAAHAMSTRGGILAIKLDIVNLGTEQCQSMNHIAPGKYVEIIVSDTGYGITPENIQKIFDPYFTTKGIGEGTGLGLSVTHGIIKNHGGNIIVSSRLGQGTTFRILIPYFFKKGIRIKETQPIPIPFGNAVVLFVDDVVSIGQGVQMILEHFGYEVIFKTSGKQALETFNKTPERFDIIITDLTMPEMTGDVLVSEIKKVRPDIPIILCTGLLDDDSETILSKYRVDAFIRKPYDQQTLIGIISNVIDKTKQD